MITPRDCVPRDWTRLIGNGPLGLGFDIATTAKEKSNPSSVTVTEKVGSLFIQRFVLRWKTNKEAVSMAMLEVIFEDLSRAQIRPRRFCIDATSERFFAQRVQKEFSRFCPVQLIVASENTQHLGETFDFKTLLGNLYVNDFAESKALMPEDLWLRDDHRLVKKQGGRFVADLSPEGGHADTFDSGKLARFALEGGGRAEASGAAVGSSGNGSQLPSGLKNPMLRLAEQKIRRRTHA